MKPLGKLARLKDVDMVGQIGSSIDAEIKFTMESSKTKPEIINFAVVIT